MAWSTAGLNARAAASAALIDEVSLHTADPGATGANNEWSGGSYTRQAPTFGAPAGGVVDLSSPMAFSGPPSTVGAFIGIWGDAGATFLGSFARTSGDSAANAAGEFNVNTMPITAT